MDASYGLVDLATRQAAKCVTLQYDSSGFIQLTIRGSDIGTQDHLQFMDRWDGNTNVIPNVPVIYWIDMVQLEIWLQGHLFYIILVPLGLWSPTISLTKSTFCRLVKKFYFLKSFSNQSYLPLGGNTVHGLNHKCWNI